jgi:hypothetical protein
MRQLLDVFSRARVEGTSIDSTGLAPIIWTPVLASETYPSCSHPDRPPNQAILAELISDGGSV